MAINPLGPQHVPPSFNLPPKILQLLQELMQDLIRAGENMQSDPKTARKDFDKALKIIGELQDQKGLPPNVSNLLGKIEPSVADLAVFVGQPGKPQEEALNKILQHIQRAF